MYTRFDTESRIAVVQATDIARELGQREVGPGHLLLGLLANPRGTAYAALRDHGLDLDAARAIVASHHVEPPPRGAAGATTSSSGRRPRTPPTTSPPPGTTRTARPSGPSASTSTASARR